MDNENPPPQPPPQPSGQTVQSESSAVLPREAIGPISGAYYEAVARWPETARTRAQAGFTVAGAAAAALAAAGFASHIASASIVIQILGLIGVGSWVLAAALYIYAVASPVAGEPKPTDETPLAFARAIGSSARGERQRIDGRAKRANFAAWFALGITLLTLVLAVALPQPVPLDAAVVGISQWEARQATDACPGLADATIVSGQVHTNSLDMPEVEIDLPQTACGKAKTLDIPQSQIAFIVQSSQCHTVSALANRRTTPVNQFLQLRTAVTMSSRAAATNSASPTPSPSPKEVIPFFGC